MVDEDVLKKIQILHERVEILEQRLQERDQIYYRQLAARMDNMNILLNDLYERIGE